MIGVLLVHFVALQGTLHAVSRRSSGALRLVEVFRISFGRGALSDKMSTAMNRHAKFVPRIVETDIGRFLWKNYCVTRGQYPQNGYVFWQLSSVPDALRFTFDFSVSAAYRR